MIVVHFSPKWAVLITFFKYSYKTFCSKRITSFYFFLIEIRLICSVIFTLVLLFRSIISVSIIYFNYRFSDISVAHRRTKKTFNASFFVKEKENNSFSRSVSLILNHNNASQFLFSFFVRYYRSSMLISLFSITAYLTVKEKGDALR
jgi:hypothetical protein